MNGREGGEGGYTKALTPLWVSCCQRVMTRSVKIEPRGSKRISLGSKHWQDFLTKEFH